MKDSDTGKVNTLSGQTTEAEKSQGIFVGGSVSKFQRLKERLSIRAHKRVAIIVVIAVLITAGVGYFVFTKVQNKVSDTNEDIPSIKSKDLSESLEAVDINSLSSDRQVQEHATRGLVYASEGNYEKALESYQKAKELNTKPDEAILYGLIQVAKNLKRDDLVKVYQSELQSIIQNKADQTPEDWLSLAEGYYVNGDKEKSLEYYQKFYTAVKFEDLPSPQVGVYSIAFKTEVENRIKELQ